MSKIVLWTAIGLFLGAGLMFFAAHPAGAQSLGQKVFLDKCSPCHGENGKGDGPMASNFSHHPGNFTSPTFWQGDVNKKITDAVNNGKDEMIPVDLKPDELKAVIDYITKTFKK